MPTMIKWWFAALIGPCFVELGLVSGLKTRNYQENENCALLLPSVPGRMRNLCMQLVDVDEAFTIARHKVGLYFPSREINDKSIAQLGTALQEASRILARRFSLSRREVETLLPRVDTSLTDIHRFCAHTGRTGEDKCREERYRRHDGSCNNLLRPSEGTATFPFRRLLLPQYADSISEPRVGRDGFPLPSPRLVSTTVHSDKSTKHAHLISFMFPAWGQLVDHDLTLTAETKDADSRKDIDCCGGGPGRHPNCLPIAIPEDDLFYSKKHQSCMNFARSLAGVRPMCKLGSRVQINMLTSYIDANFVYGSNYRVADSLRALQGGLLKVSPIFDHYDLKPVLPPKTLQPEDGCILSSKPNTFCFLAGDNRVNEQLALGVLHTLTVREHNRIASELGKINPYWDDETVYQEARHILAALVQHITYNEFLPVLLGDKLMEKYELRLKTKGYSNDYDPGVDATVPASFGTAAFRFGHSLLPNAMEMRSVNHKKIGEKKLSEMIQQPWDLYRPGYVDAFVLGMVSQPSQAMDSSITHQVTNHLFQEPLKTFGRDLASINLARAREHGVPGYMAFRKLCGLDDMRTWDDMWNHLPNDTVRQYLHLYSHPDDIDLWSAGVSEFPSPGSLLGPVFSCIIGTVFRDLKKGDRFWYENQGFRSSFTLGQLTQIRKYSLSRLLCNTGDNIQTIQIKALLLPDYDKNPRVSCKSKQIPDLDLHYWRDANYIEEKVPEVTDSSSPHYSGQASVTPPGLYATSDYSSVGATASQPPPIPPSLISQHPQNAYVEYHDLTSTRPIETSTNFDNYRKTTPSASTTSGYETQTAPFIDKGYEKIPPSLPYHHQSKPEGFDQVVYNLVNDQKNKSQFVVELTDTYGIFHNKLDNRRYSTKDVTLQ